MRLQSTPRRAITAQRDAGVASEPVVRQFLLSVERSERSVLVVSHEGLLPAQLYAATGAQMRIISRLRDLHLGGPVRLVLFTDRHWKKIANCLGCDPPEIWGVGGLERATPDGRYKVPQLAMHEEAALDAAYEEAVSRGLQPWTERKPGGIALRLDGFSRDDAILLSSKVWHSWSRIASAHKLTISSLRHGIEFRVPGPDRQHAIQTILSEIPVTVPVAYIGTDVLDIPALRLLGDRGLRIALDRMYRTRVADVLVRTPEEIAEFLELWRGAVRAGSQLDARAETSRLRSIGRER